MDADMALLESWRTGDRLAGEQLFTRHFAPIYRFFENKVGTDADDLAQRTFLACVAARDQFLGRSTFRTYLFTIARNELHHHLRRLALNRAVDFEITSIAEIATSPSGRLERARAVEELRAALRELPVEQQLLLELHYWFELDADKLGEVFGATAGTIRVRLLRARRALRNRLAPAAAGDDRMAAALDLAEFDGESDCS
jgi:RNA polymerase sigma factor (sigma-70 family)